MECPACRAPERSLTSSPTSARVVVGAYRAAHRPIGSRAAAATPPPPRPSPPPHRPHPADRVRSDEARERARDDTPPRRSDPRKPDRRVAVDRQTRRRR